MQVYITPYPADTCKPVSHSQPVSAPTLEAAVGMFSGAPVVLRLKRMIVLDLGGGQRMAITNYRVY